MNKSKNLQALRSKEADVFTASLPPVISEDIWGEQTKERNEMNKYVVTFSQGGAVNQQKSLFAASEQDARTRFGMLKPQATITNVRLVMLADDEPETPIYNRAYVDRLFRDGMNDY